jgi:carbon monoxide dehydrogenase subunit G
MATITREIHIDASPETVWEALRDVSALHTRLVPGFVVACEMDGPDTRAVTFFTGAVARERLVGFDEERRRLAYTVVASGLGATHHNASAEAREDAGGGTRFVWTTDVLPDELAIPIGALMDRGIGVIKATMEGAVP